MFSTTGQFYRSREWEQLRRQLMLERRDGHGDVLCEVCHKPITHPYDCIAHHVKYLTDGNVNDYDVSLNPDNIWLVHHKCHNELHKRFGASYQRHVYVVYGSPCAGKSTYVDGCALPDDLIVDIDAIYRAINTSRSKRLYANASVVRDTLVDMVKTRQGQWVNAWLVGNVFAGCYLWSDRDRQRLSEMLDAEMIHIDTDRETCLLRAVERGGENVKWVEDWFRKFSDSPHP